MAHSDFDPYELLDALKAGGDVDKIRRSVEFVLQALIELEATEAIGAAPYERNDSRTRNPSYTIRRDASGAVPGSEFSLSHILQCCNVEGLVGHDAFQPGVLVLELP